MPAPFTLDELLAVLRQGEEQDLTGYMTVREWRERLHAPEDKMRALIREGLAKGLVARQRVPREAIDGTMRPITVYAFNLGGERH